MRKPSDPHKEVKDKHQADDAAPEARHASGSGVKAWPFAPGSQLGNQVARPWAPKPSYRFNQR